MSSDQPLLGGAQAMKIAGVLAVIMGIVVGLILGFAVGAVRYDDPEGGNAVELTQIPGGTAKAYFNWLLFLLPSLAGSIVGAVLFASGVLLDVVGRQEHAGAGRLGDGPQPPAVREDAGRADSVGPEVFRGLNEAFAGDAEKEALLASMQAVLENDRATALGSFQAYVNVARFGSVEPAKIHLFDAVGSQAFPAEMQVSFVQALDRELLRTVDEDAALVSRTAEELGRLTDHPARLRGALNGLAARGDVPTDRRAAAMAVVGALYEEAWEGAAPVMSPARLVTLSALGERRGVQSTRARRLACGLAAPWLRLYVEAREKFELPVPRAQLLHVIAQCEEEVAALVNTSHIPDTGPLDRTPVSRAGRCPACLVIRSDEAIRHCTNCGAPLV